MRPFLRVIRTKLSIKKYEYILEGVLDRFREFRSSNNFGQYFTNWDSWPVDPQFRERIERELDKHPDAEILLARLDADGRAVSGYGRIPYFPNISPEMFTERMKTRVDIVLKDGKVLVRKRYGNNRLGFLRQLCCLVHCMHIANVPAVYSVKVPENTLYVNLIQGRCLNHVLADAGARILILQTVEDPEISKLPEQDRVWAVLERGKRLLRSSVPQSFIEDLKRQIGIIHEHGITGMSLTFGNIIISPDQRAWIIDFDKAEMHLSRLSPLFFYRRLKDQRLFHKLYD